MSDNRFARFKLKATIDGITQVEGHFTYPSLTIVINDILMSQHAPTMDFRILMRALEGYHLHYDAAIGKAFLAFEIVVVGDPPGYHNPAAQPQLPAA